MRRRRLLAWVAAAPVLDSGAVDPEGLPAAYDREAHRREQTEPWKDLESRGAGVHVEEWGAFRHTPHGATPAWGWALWSFRRPRLDRKMLDLLQRY